MQLVVHCIIMYIQATGLLGFFNMMAIIVKFHMHARICIYIFNLIHS